MPRPRKGYTPLCKTRRRYQERTYPLKMLGAGVRSIPYVPAMSLGMLKLAGR
jgi:hypothetical protein